MGLDFSKKVCYNNFRCGGVAQLVRAFGSHPRGRGFEPLRLHHVGMDCAPFEKPSRKAGLFSYRSVIPPSPHETLLAQIFAGTPAARWGRQSASGAPPAAAFCFVFRPLLDRGGRICYADSQIIRKESVTHKTMDDGDSTEGENSPLPHIQSFIGHSLCLRE